MYEVLSKSHSNDQGTNMYQNAVGVGIILSDRNRMIPTGVDRHHYHIVGRGMVFNYSYIRQ